MIKMSLMISLGMPQYTNSAGLLNIVQKGGEGVKSMLKKTSDLIKAFGHKIDIKDS